MMQEYREIAFRMALPQSESIDMLLSFNSLGV
ncbi:hypothetical protein TSMEX_001176 [Taenia solium]|eukprot:TsM_000442300 transcript=TsM_000442300 gene=TsM_000442300